MRDTGSEELAEGRSIQVQWFERDRLEIQADGTLTAGRLGARYLELTGRPWFFNEGGTAAVMMVPIALLVDRPWMLSAPGLVTWGALLGLALLSTALAYGIYFRLLATAGATNLLLVTFLIPVSALLLGTLILGERLAAGDVVGMAAIGLGLVASDGRLLRRLRLRGASTTARQQ